MTPVLNHVESYIKHDLIVELKNSLITVKNKSLSIFLIEPHYEVELSSLIFQLPK